MKTALVIIGVPGIGSRFGGGIKQLGTGRNEWGDYHGLLDS